MKNNLLKYGAVAAVFATAGYLIGHKGDEKPAASNTPAASTSHTAPTSAQPQYRFSGALSEQFYRPVSGGATFYELGADNKLVNKGTFDISTCIEITDGHEGVETAAVKISNPWKPNDSFKGYVYKDELTRAPECKPAGP
jgi:hypothetical protein